MRTSTRTAIGAAIASALIFGATASPAMAYGSYTSGTKKCASNQRGHIKVYQTGSARIYSPGDSSIYGVVRSGPYTDVPGRLGGGVWSVQATTGFIQKIVVYCA